MPAPIDSFLHAWKIHDVDQLASHWSEWSQLVDPADPLTGGAAVIGREAMRAYYRRLFEQIPDAALEGLSAVGDGHGIAWLWRFSGSSEGRPWTAAGASYFRLDEEGLILSDHAVWDSTIMSSEGQEGSDLSD